MAYVSVRTDEKALSTQGKTSANAVERPQDLQSPRPLDYLQAHSTELCMSPFLILNSTRLDAACIVIARAQASVTAAAAYFYGYWFSHRRA